MCSLILNLCWHQVASGAFRASRKLQNQPPPISPTYVCESFGTNKEQIELWRIMQNNDLEHHVPKPNYYSIDSNNQFCVRVHKSFARESERKQSEIIASNFSAPEAKKQTANAAIDIWENRESCFGRNFLIPSQTCCDRWCSLQV